MTTTDHVEPRPAPPAPPARQYYASAEEAIAAGVPEDKIARVLTITAGPFRGRQYQIRPSGMRDRIEDATPEQLAAAVQRLEIRRRLGL